MGSGHSLVTFFQSQGGARLSNARAADLWTVVLPCSPQAALLLFCDALCAFRPLRWLETNHAFYQPLSLQSWRWTHVLPGSSPSTPGPAGVCSGCLIPWQVVTSSVKKSIPRICSDSVCVSICQGSHCRLAVQVSEDHPNPNLIVLKR